jgi:hypothetical protein
VTVFRPGKAVKVTDTDMVTAEMGAVGRADGITSVQRLSGGAIADVWLISYAGGSATGHLRTPQVLAATRGLILLEALSALKDNPLCLRY